MRCFWYTGIMSSSMPAMGYSLNILSINPSTCAICCGSALGAFFRTISRVIDFTCSSVFASTACVCCLTCIRSKNFKTSSLLGGASFDFACCARRADEAKSRQADDTRRTFIFFSRDRQNSRIGNSRPRSSAPPTPGTAHCHIALPQCAATGCIWRCGRYATPIQS